MQRFASVIVVNARGWVLLQERDSNPAIDPDRWSFVGGHVERDELPLPAAYRELEEETGLHLDSGLEPAGVHPVFHVHSGSLDALHLYAVCLDLTDDDVECHEGRQIVFVDPTTVSELPLGAGAAVALPAFLESDLYRQMARCAP